MALTLESINANPSVVNPGETSEIFIDVRNTSGTNDSFDVFLDLIDPSTGQILQAAFTPGIGISGLQTKTVSVTIQIPTFGGLVDALVTLTRRGIPTDVKAQNQFFSVLEILAPPPPPPTVPSNVITKRGEDNLVVECEFTNKGNVPGDFFYGVSIGRDPNIWHDVAIYNDGKGEFDQINQVPAGGIAVGTRSMTVPIDLNITGAWDVWVRILSPDLIIYDQFIATNILTVDDPAFKGANILRLVLS